MSPSSSSMKPTSRPLLRAARVASESTHNTEGDLPRGLRCEYPSKFCNNHKAHKEKGGLHKFCDYHREKANQNQKRWQQRRRDARDQQRMKNSARSASATAVSRSAKTLEDANALSVETVSSPTDFIEPFPISDLVMATTAVTPPHYSYTAQVYAPPVSFMAGMDPAFQYPFGFSESEPVDLVSQIMFNDPTMNNFHSYNWSLAKMDPGFESFAVTGLNGAIV